MSVITFQYRVKDSTSRKHLMRMACAVHTVWNYCNEVSMLAWRRERRWLSAYDLHGLVTGTSTALGLQSQAIQHVCTEFVTRRRQFRKRRLAWRSRKRSLGWIPFPNQAIRLQGDSIRFGGRLFRLWLSRPVEGTIKAGSFTQDARGRWYVNLHCEVTDRTEPLGEAEIGIDLGLAQQIACSDGVVYSRENLTRQYEDKLALAQRGGKKKRGKALYAKIANCRKDWTHKATTAIARRARFIAVGDVSSTKLAQTRFAKATYDAGWGMCRHQLHYKAIRLAGVCVPVSERFSSVTCSACLCQTGPRGLGALGVRVWTCSACGTQHNRDINSAHNHLRAGRCTPLKGIPRLEPWGGRQCVGSALLTEHRESRTAAGRDHRVTRPPLAASSPPSPDRPATLHRDGGASRRSNTSCSTARERITSNTL
jgi:putative transposase